MISFLSWFLEGVLPYQDTTVPECLNSGVGGSPEISCSESSARLTLIKPSDAQPNQPKTVNLICSQNVPLTIENKHKFCPHAGFLDS
jgi:hypothetical protein